VIYLSSWIWWHVELRRRSKSFVESSPQPTEIFWLNYCQQKATELLSSSFPFRGNDTKYFWRRDSAASTFLSRIFGLVVIPSVYRIFSASVRNTRNSSIIRCVWCQMRTAFLTPTVYEIQLWKRNEITRSASHCWCCWNEKQILHWAQMITQFLHVFYIKCCYSWCQPWSAIVFFLVLAIPIIFRNWQTTAHRLNVCTEHSPKRKITYWARKRKTNWIMKMNAQ